jgi:hypothetical protein
MALPKKKKKKKISDDLWALAKTKYHLSSRQIEMAKKLGMNPKKFGSLVPNKSEPWKKPLGQFIESCYYKRFKKQKTEPRKNETLDKPKLL